MVSYEAAVRPKQSPLERTVLLHSVQTARKEGRYEQRCTKAAYD